MGAIVRLLGIFIFGACVSASGQELNVAVGVADYKDTLQLPQATAIQSIKIKTQEQIQSLESSYDSVQALSGGVISKLQSLIDSLKVGNTPTGFVLKKMDSVVQWKDKQLGVLRFKVDSVKAKFTDEIKGLNIPESEFLIEKLNSLSDKLNISSPVLPSVGDLNVPNLDVSGNLSSLIDPLKERVILPQAEKLDLGSIGKPELLQGKLSEEVTSLSSETMGQLNEFAGLDDVKRQIGEVDELNQSLTRLSDEDAAREMMMSEFKEQALDHFAGKQAQIDEAIATMEKFKKKFENAQDVTKLPKRPPNPMREKSFGQRLLPGFSFQINLKDAWMVDFNPYIGYWINGHIVVGLGWNQRIGYRSSSGFDSDLCIFGPRVYGDYLIAKGFSVRLESELMKVVVPTQFSSGRIDENGREWVFGALVGIKKSYRLIKRVNGTAMMLYSVYNPEHRSPYQDRLSVRIGIEIQSRNKKKKV